MYLIFGLGNPGPRYETTRHNTGFLAVDTLSEKHNIHLDKHNYRCVYGDGKIGGVEIRIAKPVTYMNLSGKAVRAAQMALQVRPEQIIVVYDEIDLPLGKIKVKHSGGDAGNLGIRSIIESLQTDRFTRVRIGIGRPEDRDEIVDYVLSPFDDDEIEQLNEILEHAATRIEDTLKEICKQTNQTEE